MVDVTEVVLLLGLMFAVGLAAEFLGRRTPLPRVTLLLVAGLLMGPSALGLVDPFGTAWFTMVSQIALTMVGFLLGGHLSRRALAAHGRDVMVLSLVVVTASALLVFLAVWLVSGDLVLALILGGLAAATDPAATTDVVGEDGAKGDFVDRLLGIVAIDDAWGIALFSVLLAVAGIVVGTDTASVLRSGAWELGGAVLLGMALGVPVAYASGRISPGEPTLVEALAVVFLCLGGALWLEVSFLLAAVVMGIVVANLAKHHERPFHEVEHLRWPFMVVFFLLAGAALHLDAVVAAGAVGGAFVVARVLGRLSGGELGARLRGMDTATRHWIGPALLPQAGVAVGMALIAAQRFPDRADVILSVTFASTVLFEVIGPPLTRVALRRARAPA